MSREELSADSSAGSETAAQSSGSPTEDQDRDELLARITRLDAENRRLREEYARARRSQYRRTALGLFLVGVVAAGGGFLFPDARTVLFALGGIGIFGGALTIYLTPESFVPASVGERVYRASAENGAALVADLGLSDHRVYVPVGDEDDAVRLYVPQSGEYDVPGAAELEAVFVLGAAGQRGVSLRPTGEPLFAEFERTLTAPLADRPVPLLDQLATALVEQFEIADSAEGNVDEDAGRAEVSVTGSAYGDIDQFDHPIASFLAVGFARAFERPVHIRTVTGDDREGTLVVLEWETGDE